MKKIQRIAVETAYGEDGANVGIIEGGFMTSAGRELPLQLAPETEEETEAKRRRACNYAPIEHPMDLPLTVGGVSILGIEIAKASGMHPRRRPLGPWSRLLRRLLGA